MSNYTEKTSGAQIKQVLSMLFGDKEKNTRLQWDNDNVGIRVYDFCFTLPSIGEIVEVLNTCEINPRFVTIDNTWGHLTMWFCNYDGSDIEIGDQ